MLEVLEESEASHAITADKLRAGARVSVATTPMLELSVLATALGMVGTRVMLTDRELSTARTRVGTKEMLLLRTTLGSRVTLPVVSANVEDFTGPAFDNRVEE